MASAVPLNLVYSGEGSSCFVAVSFFGSPAGYSGGFVDFPEIFTGKTLKNGKDFDIFSENAVFFEIRPGIFLRI